MRLATLAESTWRSGSGGSGALDHSGELKTEIRDDLDSQYSRSQDASSPVRLPDSSVPTCQSAGIDGSFSVTIEGATNLLNADWAGISDPYCVCIVQGRKERHTTKVVYDTVNPQ